jgi:hypothetical protein
MPMSKPHISPSRSIALAACAAALAFAGCVETLSLGSGKIDEEDIAGGIPILPWIPPGDPVWIDIEGGLLECHPTLDSDLDGDGFTPIDGDCDDCDPDVGPNAVEMPTAGAEPKDENCDGVLDEPMAACDADLEVHTTSPFLAARALDLCADARDYPDDHRRWGVVHAAWVLPDGAPEPPLRAYLLGHGVLDRFGPNVPVRFGARMLALSSGTARQPTDPDYVPPRGFDKDFTCEAPEGFPKHAASCPSVTAGEPHDGMALELRLSVPQNAEALAFDFNFYTYELPGNFCTPHDDLFAALLHPPPGDQLDANIAFDGAGNVVSVNSVFLEACDCAGGPPCTFGGRVHACTLGSAPLVGTGFGDDCSHEGDRGATGWVTSTGPVARGGLVTLRFSIHDAADGDADSTVLLDHFRWLRREPLVPKSRARD